MLRVAMDAFRRDGDSGDLQVTYFNRAANLTSRSANSSGSLRG